MTRETFLPFHQPDLDGDELAAIKAVLDSGWLTTGEKTRQFEREFARYLGARHAIAVSSCTAALHLALEAVGVQAGDVVLTSPYTFAATAEVVRYFDAVPVFVDVQPDTLNMDPERLVAVLETGAYASKVITKKPKAVLPVHMAGHPCEMDAIQKLAREHDLVVIEDAAHALPARYKRRLIGGPVNFGAPDQNAESVSDVKTMTCFSFYATKTLTTGEGGMITTEEDEWAERCRVMSMHGINKDAYNRYLGEGSWLYEVIAPGYKYNFSDLGAAMGLSQLRKLERMWRRRAAIANSYTRAFRHYPELETPSIDPKVEHAWHLYILRLDLNALDIGREEFIQELIHRNIGASVHFIPLHVHPYYAQTYGYNPEDFQVAYNQSQRVISLPICSPMTDEDIEDVIEAVTDIVNAYRKKKVYGFEKQKPIR